MATLAQRLKEVRKLRGYTQKEVAKAGGIRQGTYSDLETGVAKGISGSALIGIAKLLGVRPQWLLKETGDMEYNPALDLSDEEIAMVKAFREQQEELGAVAARTRNELWIKYSRAHPIKREMIDTLLTNSQGKAVVGGE